MKFQLVSDLHTEFYEEIKISEFLTPSAPNLIVAGDLGNPFHPGYKSFLQQASLLFEHIFLVAGNHEYYGAKSMQESEDEIRKIVVPLSNVHYLQRGCYAFGGLVIAGVTLWSHIPDWVAPRIKMYMNDYRQIQTTPQETSQQHKQDLDWLQGVLSDLKENEQVLIITHHLTSFELIAPQYKDSLINHGFTSDLESSLFDQKVEKDKIVAICSGHTHNSFNRKLKNGVQCYVNPRGYPSDSSIENQNYNPSFVFETMEHCDQVE